MSFNLLLPAVQLDPSDPSAVSPGAAASIISPRDPSTGMATGKRVRKPISATFPAVR